MEKAPFVIVQETIDTDTWWAAIANAPRHLQIVKACAHCWHAPRDWQQGTSHVPVPRLCCWCGMTEGPHHGPYAPEGGEGHGRG